MKKSIAIAIRSVTTIAGALLVTAVLGPAAGATPIAYEGFSPSFPVYANGGTGFGAPWTRGGFNAPAANYATRARSLCYRQLDAGEGGSVAGEAFAVINGAVRDLAQPLGANGTTVYLGFLVQPRGTLNDGVFNGFFGLTLNGSLGNELFIGKPGGGVVDEYVLENRGGGGQVPSGVPAVVGRVTLLVVKAQFQPGNDVFSLYVDPTPGRPEPGTPIVKTDLDLGAVSRIGIYSTGAFAIDEIRIGTAYADVVPTGDNSPDPEFPGCLNGPQ